MLISVFIKFSRYGGTSCLTADVGELRKWRKMCKWSIKYRFIKFHQFIPFYTSYYLFTQKCKDDVLCLLELITPFIQVCCIFAHSSQFTQFTSLFHSLSTEARNAQYLSTDIRNRYLEV